MSEFLFLGDLHVGKYPKGVLPSYSYLESIFQQVEEYAVKNGIETVVQLGDLHDVVHVSEDDRLFMLEQFSRSKCLWHTYYGNHEFESVDQNSFNFYLRLQKLFLLKNVNFYTHPTITKLHDLDVAFLPWPAYQVKSKRPLLCFGHFSKAGAKGDTGYVLKNDVEISEKHNWIIGDLHAYQKGSNYCYIGAPLQLRYGDTDKRYFGHYTGSNKKFKYKKIPIQLPYRLNQISILDIEKIDAAISFLENRVDNVYTKIKVSAEVLSDFRYEKIKSTNRTVVEYTDKRKNDTDDEKVVLIDSKSVRNDLVRKRLAKKGFSKEEIRRALTMVNNLENGE